MSTVFITGGSGFVGRHLISALLDQGREIHALARSADAAQKLEELGAKPVLGDLSDVHSLQGVMSGCEDVIHSATMMMEWAPYKEFHAVNVLGTQALLAEAKASGIRRFLQIGAAPVIKNGTGPTHMADETWPLARVPWSAYIDTKSLAEKIVRQANTPQMKTIVVRPPAIWGKGAHFLDVLRERVEAGRWAWIGGGRYDYVFCHVQNVCEGTMLALDHGVGGEAYNLNDGQPVQFRGFFEHLFKSLNLAAGDRQLPFGVAMTIGHAVEGSWRFLRLKSEPPMTRMVPRLMGQEFTTTDRKAREALGYEAALSIEEGMAELAST